MASFLLAVIDPRLWIIYSSRFKHFHPKVLLGLTATPERMDGKSILDYFNGRIAAEIRLPAAIDRKLLCPFQYFGVSDTVELSGYVADMISMTFPICMF